MAAKNENLGALNFPGLQVARDIFDIYMRAAQAQTNTWNEAWKAIIDGKYEAKDLIRTLAFAHEKHCSAIDELVRYPLNRNVEANVPAWSNIDLLASEIVGPVTRRVKTRTFGEETHLVWTELAPFGASNISFLMSIQQDKGDLDHVSVTIEGWIENGTRYSLRDPDSVARLTMKVYLGQYLGMVYDSRQASEPPLLVVTLRIKGRASESTAVELTGEAEGLPTAYDRAERSRSE